MKRTLNSSWIEVQKGQEGDSPLLALKKSNAAAGKASERPLGAETVPRLTASKQMGTSVLQLQNLNYANKPKKLGGILSQSLWILTQPDWHLDFRSVTHTNYGEHPTFGAQCLHLNFTCFNTLRREPTCSRVYLSRKPSHAVPGLQTCRTVS